MPDAPLVEEGDGLEQVLAEALDFVDGERAMLAQFLGERVLPHVLNADEGTAGVRRPGREGMVKEAGDVRVVKGGELLGLTFQAAGGRVVERDLEAGGVVSAVGRDEDALEVEPVPSCLSTVQPRISSPAPAVSGSCSGSGSGAVSSSSILSRSLRSWRTESVRSAQWSWVASRTRASMAGLRGSMTVDGSSAWA